MCVLPVCYLCATLQDSTLFSKIIKNTDTKKTPKTQGLIVISNYFVLHEGEERCDREGHAVFPFFVGLS